MHRISIVSLAALCALLMALGWVYPRALSAGPTLSGPHEVYFSDVSWPGSLNPYQTTTAVEQEQLGLTQPMANLVQVSPSGQLSYPEMVSPPTVTGNGLTISFELNHNMFWDDHSNGDASTQISAVDYLFSWHILMNQNTGPACTATCDRVAVVELPDATPSCLDGSDPSPDNCGFRVILHLKHTYAAALPNALVGLAPHTASYLGSSEQLQGCIAAISGCDAVALNAENGNVSYEPGGTGGDGMTAGPYVVTLYDPNNEIDYTQNPNFTRDMGLDTTHGNSIQNEPASLKFVFYPDIPTMISNADANDTDVTQGYTLLQYASSLQHDPNFTTKVGTGANAEVLIFNTLNAHPRIDGGGPRRADSVVDGGAGSSGEEARQALYLSLNFPGLIDYAYHVGISRSVASTSYCAPIYCSPNSQSPFNDYKAEKSGVWDPLAHAFVKPGTKKALKDARKMFRDSIDRSCHHKSKCAAQHVTLYIATTSASVTRSAEESYLQISWQRAFSNLKVVTEQVSPSKFFDSVWGEDGTLAHGHFEAAIYGFDGVPPDPDNWKFDFLGSRCMQTDRNHAPADAAYACFHNSSIDSALSKAAGTLNGKSRTADYRTFQQQVSKHAIWHIIAPRPNIWTTDGKPPSGFHVNSWLPYDTWNAANWQM